MSSARAAARAKVRQQREERLRRYQDQVDAVVAAKKAKQLSSDAARLAMADQARDSENIYLASTIYLRLAISRRDSEHVATAKQRLLDLQQLGKDRIAEIDATLAENQSLSVSERSLEEKTKVVMDAFSEYRDLARHFSKVPRVGTKIKTQFLRQRNKPEFASVLNEPRAMDLVAQAKEFEGCDRMCCAVLAYEQAAKISHASSASKAKARLEELNKDSKVVASARRCKELRACHKIYLIAEAIRKANPNKAKKMFSEVVLRAPNDTEVYREARRMINELRGA